MTKLRLDRAAGLSLRHLRNVLYLGGGRKEATLPFIIIMILVISILLVSNGMFGNLWLRFDFLLILNFRPGSIFWYCFVVYQTYYLLKSIYSWRSLSPTTLVYFRGLDLNFRYFFHAVLDFGIFLDLFQNHITGLPVLASLVLAMVLLVCSVIVTEVKFHIHLLWSVVWLSVAVLCVYFLFLACYWCLGFVFLWNVHFWIYCAGFLATYQQWVCFKFIYY